MLGINGDPAHLIDPGGELLLVESDAELALVLVLASAVFFFYSDVAFVHKIGTRDAEDVDLAARRQLPLEYELKAIGQLSRRVDLAVLDIGPNKPRMAKDQGVACPKTTHYAQADANDETPLDQN